MREQVDAERVGVLMRELGAAAARTGRCYLAGGTTAVLIGWRPTTIDADIAFVPKQDEVLRKLPAIKQRLRMNVELASPADFTPLPQGWEKRSASVGREGRLAFHHFDPYSEALSKLERAHTQDLEDVEAMLDLRLIERAPLKAFFGEIETELYRFPAIDLASFRRRVEEAALH